MRLTRSATRRVPQHAGARRRATAAAMHSSVLALAILMAQLPTHGQPAHARAPAPAQGQPISTAQPFLPASIGRVGFPGGIVRVPLPPDTTAVSANGRQALRYGNDAIVPVPLTAQPGSGSIEATTSAGTVLVTFRIEARAYAEQRLTIANPRLVDPAPEDLRRIEREQLQIDAARDRFSPAPPPTLSLAAPVRGPLSSPFGTRRILNGQPRNPHNGLDFAVPTGAPITAPLAGEVAGVGNYFFTGNTVFIDHGQGFVTMYGHLSRVDVKTGDRLREGDAIGRVGATGRATGPHLHWAVYLGNVAVDPKLLLRTTPRPR